jgi:hypothetical protein
LCVTISNLADEQKDEGLENILHSKVQ